PSAKRAADTEPVTARPLPPPSTPAEPAAAPVTGPAGGEARGRLNRQQLEGRYQAILDKLDEFGIPIQLPGAEERFEEGPASVLFRVRPGPGVDPRRIYEKADALKLCLALAEEQNIRFGIDHGFVTIDVPKNESERYFVAASAMWKRW